MNSIWNENPEAFANIKNEARKWVLFPEILKIIQEKKDCAKILDYGCGDGSLASLFNKNMEIGLFDIDERPLEKAGERLAGQNFLIFTDDKAIPHQYYDVITNSLVMMTIDNKNLYKQILINMKNAKKPDGIVIIAVTHPCFRQFTFSTHLTEYSQGKEFDYFKEGEPFKVYLTDIETDEKVHFTDFHWSLTFALNAILETGMQIIKIKELADMKYKEHSYNHLVSPFMIIVAK